MEKYAKEQTFPSHLASYNTYIRYYPQQRNNKHKVFIKTAILVNFKSHCAY